jgi:hypothetical protein
MYQCLFVNIVVSTSVFLREVDVVPTAFQLGHRLFPSKLDGLRIIL